MSVIFSLRATMLVNLNLNLNLLAYDERTVLRSRGESNAGTPTPVQLNNTNFGAAITPAERLAVTLRYLAAGMGHLFFITENAVIISTVQGRRQKMISGRARGLTCLGTWTPGPFHPLLAARRPP